MANRKAFSFNCLENTKILEEKVWGINFLKFIIEIIFVMSHGATDSVEEKVVFLSSKSTCLFEPSMFFFVFFLLVRT